MKRATDTEVPIALPGCFLASPYASLVFSLDLDCYHLAVFPAKFVHRVFLYDILQYFLECDNVYIIHFTASTQHRHPKCGFGGIFEMG